MAVLLLIDDHPLVEVALEAALSQSPIPVQLLSASSEHAARPFLQQPLDIIVLDIGLPESDGLEILRRLKIHRPHCPVLIYSAQQTRHYIRRAQALGASGYVVKSQRMTQLLSAILAVLGGQTAFPETEEEPELPLTHKERQILALLASGLSNLQIAAQLHISNKTVSTHKKNILEKTGARSVVELADLWKAQQ
ncbi:response regulator transcription factor [Pantoea anthophila]|uniref:Response regulator transcription factor n=1 Tax=Pantoea anthophila TaxID=470931 RepID=A0ABY2Z627_9GAMM|nr:response regulator transcription factor [Pantoea anthophila]TPV24660.1 response regulator transcription factor [Pantoea anthophila]WIM55301.1 response regulator transcription factor [Pantoea anthophila]